MWEWLRRRQREAPEDDEVEMVDQQRGANPHGAASLAPSAGSREEQVQGRRWKAWSWILAAWVVAGIVLAVGIMGYAGATARVPDMVGDTADGAEQALHSEGFEVEMAARGTSEEDVGEVVGQDPAPYSNQVEGSTVTITVGEPNMIEVPDLAGTTPEEARRRVGEYFRIDVDGEISSEKDIVIGQDPTAGSQAPQGSEILVTTISSQYPLPPNGEIRYFSQDPAVAPFEIDNSTESNYLVKLVDANSGLDVLDVFVRKGSEVEVSVPNGSYIVEEASGTDWYGYEYRFGPETVYSKYSKVLNIHQYSIFDYTYRIFELPPRPSY